MGQLKLRRIIWKEPDYRTKSGFEATKHVGPTPEDIFEAQRCVRKMGRYHLLGFEYRKDMVVKHDHASG